MNLVDRKTELEKQKARIEKELKEIEASATFKKEKRVSRALMSLMKRHNISAKDLIALLQKNGAYRQKSVPATRKKRVLSIYKNPHSGETVETRGGNHKTLKAWKAEYNLESVKEWLIDVKN